MVPKGSFFNDVDMTRYLGTGKYLSESLHLGEHGENMLCTEIVLNVSEGGNEGGRVATHTNFSVFPSYDMKSL